MWIDRKIYEDMKTEMAVALAQAATLDKQNGMLQTHLDWLRLRVNQLEQERAQLYFRVADIKISTPVIEQVAPMSKQPRVGSPFHEMPSFEDMGDDEAREQGVGHDSAGNLVFTR